MLTVLLMVTAPIEVRRDGPPLSLERARQMSAAQLGDTVLAPGHPAIVEASVGPEGMGPPPFPGTPVASEIRLYTAGHLMAGSGFCRKNKVTVTLRPVLLQGGQLPPAPAETASSTALYRWAERTNRAIKCEAGHHDFFQLDHTLADRSFAVIRLLDRSRRGADRRLQVTIDDQAARSMRDYVNKHRSEARGLPKEAITPIVNGRVALRKFPISSITMIRPFAKAWDANLLTVADLHDATGRALEAVTIFAGGEWLAGIVLDGDRITTIRFIKAIPPPF